MIRCRFINRKLATCCKTKVSNLDIIESIGTAADENILWFQVSMDDAEAVDVSKPFEDLPEKPPDFRGVLV